MALLTLLSFHCFLRPAEARNVRWTDIHCEPDTRDSSGWWVSVCPRLAVSQVMRGTVSGASLASGSLLRADCSQTMWSAAGLRSARWSATCKRGLSACTHCDNRTSQQGESASSQHWHRSSSQKCSPIRWTHRHPQLPPPQAGSGRWRWPCQCRELPAQKSGASRPPYQPSALGGCENTGVGRRAETPDEWRCAINLRRRARGTARGTTDNGAEWPSCWCSCAIQRAQVQRAQQSALYSCPHVSLCIPHSKAHPPGPPSSSPAATLQLQHVLLLREHFIFLRHLDTILHEPVADPHILKLSRLSSLSLP